MEFSVDLELNPDLRLQEDLGPGRGWLASGGRETYRVFSAIPSLSSAPGHRPEVAGELAPAATGEGWVAYPYRKQSLADFLEGHPGVDLEEALEMGSRIADVAVALAAQGRTHLGLCARVIFFGETGELEVAGFEARLDGDSYRGYRPSEQRSRDEGGGASATYATGALLYHLLTGDPPAAPGPPPASRKNPAVPNWIDRVVSLSLEPDPNHRYDSLKTFRSALGAAKAAIRLRAGEGATPESFTEVSSSRPPPHACGPGSPLGRRRPGGLRPLPPEATQVGLPDAPAQDRLGMAKHPDSIGAILPEREEPKAPEYRFSWRVTLTRGLPALLVMGAIGAWMGLWLWGLWGG